MKNTKFSVFKLAACMLALAGCILLLPNQQTYAAELQKDNYNGWYYENGQAYWYDNGVLARSKEVYDPQTDAWYWFEADGTMARDKDVFIVLNADVDTLRQRRQNGKRRKLQKRCMVLF